MKNTIFYIFIILSLSYAQNFLYSEEDWITITSPNEITSISHRYDEILISALNGIFVYDFQNNNFFFSNHINKELLDEVVSIVHFDKFRDHIWILTDNQIMFKSYNSNIWRSIYFYDIALSSHNNVYNIGSDENFIILEVHDGFRLLDPYTGYLVENNEDITLNIDLINWSSSSKSGIDLNVDITKYFSLSDWNILNYKQLEKHGKITTITTAKEDNQDNIWLGTQSGEIFVIDKNSRTIEEFNSVPLASNMKLVYLDEYDEWWIADNDWIYLDTQYNYEQEIIFVCRWNEYENKWYPYYQNKYPHIQSKDINSIIRKNNWLYIGTTFGLLTYDLIDDVWKLYDESNGYSNVEDIVFYNNDLYIATNRGINVFSSIINKPILYDINNMPIEVFDLELEDNILYFISDFGFYKVNIITNELTKISDRIFSEIIIDNSIIYLVENNNIFKYIHRNNKNVLKKIFKFPRIKNVDICNNYIWVHNKNKVGLYDQYSNTLFEYDYLDGIPGTIINQIECDEDWVWFVTNSGLTFYNWSRYHYEKN